VTVPYTAEEMFDLVDAIGRYPEFLPWCAGSSAVRDGEDVRGSMDVHFGPFRKRFATRNRHVRPGRIDVKLEEGPLDDLTGSWNFTDNGDGTSSISIEITFRFSGALHQKVASKVFMAIYSKMLDAFRRRAQRVRTAFRFRPPGGEGGFPALRILAGAGAKHRLLGRR